MKPMQPMDFGPAWWPEDLGQPASSGGQGGVRYAFFPGHRRLAVQRDGEVTLYDSGEHRLTGVSQEGGGDRPLAFTSRKGGEVRLDRLRKVGWRGRRARCAPGCGGAGRASPSAWHPTGQETP